MTNAGSIKLQRSLEAILSQEAKLALTGRPADPDLAFERGICLNQMAHYEEALAAFEEAAGLREAQALEPDPVIYRHIALVMFRMCRYKEALAAIIQAARLRNDLGLPEDWELSRIRGNCACRLGHYDDALSAYKHAEQIQLAQGLPVYPFLAMNRGAVYQEMSQMDKALEEFDKTSRLLEEQGLPQDHDLEMNRGVVYENQLRFNEALEAYDRAEELLRDAGLPEDVNLLMNRGVVLSALGRMDEAMALYDRSEALRRERGQLDSPVLIFHRALTLYKAQRTEQATAEALHAIQECSLQNISVKPIFIETLRDWMSGESATSEPNDGIEQQHLTKDAIPANGKQYDAFISYRRKTSQGHAMLLHNHLTQSGLEVFRDQDDLSRGQFRESLVQAVQQSRYMIVLLSEGFFERCANEDDEVRRELRAALECGTTIIPVMMEGYVWPDSSELPEDIRGICQINAISFSSEFFYAFVEKLMRWMA